MILIKARFTLNADGRYATAGLKYQISEWAYATLQFNSLAEGYYLGTGQVCSLEQLIVGPFNPPEDAYDIPNDLPKLHAWLNKLRRMS